MRRLFGFVLLSGVLLGLLLTVLDRESSRQAAQASAGNTVVAAVRPSPARMPAQGTTGSIGSGHAAAPNPAGRSIPAAPDTRPAGPDPRLSQPGKTEGTEVLRLARVVVTDSGRLKAEEEKLPIRLLGVSLPDRAWTCKLPSGQTWPCGERAAAALSSFIRTRPVDCEVRARTATEILGVCRVDRTDLSTWLLRRGWAELTEGADKSHAEALRAAKKDKLGLWDETAAQGKSPPNGQSARR